MAWRGRPSILIHDERKLGLRIIRVHQEGGPAVHIRSQQPHAFIGRIPRLNHDVVELFAQEVFHHSFVLRLDFKEIREHAHRGQASLHDARLEQPAH